MTSRQHRDQQGAPSTVTSTTPSPPGTTDALAVPVSSLSYAEASRELDAIVAFFEDSEVDVDQLVTKLQRATALVDELDRRLRATTAQVEELVPKLAEASRSDAGPSTDEP